MVAVKWNGRGELAVLRGGMLVRWKGHHAVGEDVRWEALPGLARARLHVRVYVPNAMSEYADCVGLDETLRLDFDGTERARRASSSARARAALRRRSRTCCPRSQLEPTRPAAPKAALQPSDGAMR